MLKALLLTGISCGILTGSWWLAEKMLEDDAEVESKVNELREGVQKDIWTDGGDRRFHIKLYSDSSTISFLQNRTLEELKNSTCIIGNQNEARKELPPIEMMLMPVVPLVDLYLLTFAKEISFYLYKKESHDFYCPPTAYR